MRALQSTGKSKTFFTWHYALVKNSLCLGIIEQNFEIINNYGELELIPILDKNDKYNWEILEDSEDEKLTKQVKYFLDNK